MKSTPAVFENSGLVVASMLNTLSRVAKEKIMLKVWRLHVKLGIAFQLRRKPFPDNLSSSMKRNSSWRKGVLF